MALIEIENNYSFFVPIIEQCEAEEFSIEKAFKLVDSLRIANNPCQIINCISNRMQKNDISMLMNFENKSINPIECAQLIKCQATTCGFKRSFSMQNKMMQKDRIFFARKRKN